MEVEIREERGIRFAEGVPGQCLIRDMDDAAALIGFCLGNHLDLVLLHAESFTDSFYKLASGVAGELLQKLRNYGIRLAAVLPPERIKGKFAEMVAEENRGAFFHVSAGREEAEAWLIGQS